jgi:hypothetical protein
MGNYRKRWGKDKDRVGWLIGDVVCGINYKWDEVCGLVGHPVWGIYAMNYGDRQIKDG